METINLSFLAVSSAAIGLAAIVFMRLANFWGLVAHPNSRSSHGTPTVTGMGVLVPIAVLVYYLWQPQALSWGFVLGFTIVSVISFIDDVYFLKHSLRLIFQCIGLGLMILHLPFQSSGIEIMAIGTAALILGIGVINAYNFMDGVNGMLTLHSILVLLSFLFLNENLIDFENNSRAFTDSDFIINLIIPLTIFAIFNVRVHAKAFIGDVGAISIAFVILYLMFSLLLQSGNYAYLLLFSIFGADAGLTVCYKLILGENIFVPHRDFVFKKLVHIKKLSHLRVSLYYLSAQAVINLVIIFIVPQHPKLSSQLSILFIGTVVLIAAYITLQHQMNKIVNANGGHIEE
ncbi:hypothetical protein N9J24_01580 [Bacteroidia bacterium]|jgi:UDP-GlcNAc:undecaprenyl-phosphate/decaprenyl-phosphate GlcNAc-1-phosphate transferase|nr:hypothetical protein [Bacteroidia bacterium]